jgi:hypothetical protein
MSGKLVGVWDGLSKALNDLNEVADERWETGRNNPDHCDHKHHHYHNAIKCVELARRELFETLGIVSLVPLTEEERDQTVAELGQLVRQQTAS